MAGTRGRAWMRSAFEGRLWAHVAGILRRLSCLGFTPPPTTLIDQPVASGGTVRCADCVGWELDVRKCRRWAAVVRPGIMVGLEGGTMIDAEARRAVQRAG